MGRSEEALAHFREAAAIDPEYADAHNNMASALVKLNRMDDAIKELLIVGPTQPFTTATSSKSTAKRE